MKLSEVEFVLEFYRSGAESGLIGIEQVLKEDDAYETASQYYGCFKDFVNAVCIQIRHKLGNPTESLEKALNVADDGTDFVLKSFLSKELAFHRFDVGEVILVKFLCDGTFDKKAATILPDFGLWKKSRKRKGIGNCYADAGLAFFMENRNAPENYNDILEDYRYKKGKSDLWIDTFSNYIRILESAHSNNQDETIQLIQDGDRLFDERKEDDDLKYFAAMDWGGHPEYAIDHRLAAVIRFVIDEYGIPDKAVKSIHKWRPKKK